MPENTWCVHHCLPLRGFLRFTNTLSDRPWASYSVKFLAADCANFRVWPMKTVSYHLPTQGSDGSFHNTMFARLLQIWQNTIVPESGTYRYLHIRVRFKCTAQMGLPHSASLFGVNSKSRIYWQPFVDTKGKSGGQDPALSWHHFHGYYSSFAFAPTRESKCSSWYKT